MILTHTLKRENMFLYNTKHTGSLFIPLIEAKVAWFTVGLLIKKNGAYPKLMSEFSYTSVQSGITWLSSYYIAGIRTLKKVPLTQTNP